MEDIIKSAVVQRSGKPVLCLVDDTVSSKTKPLSRALHLIEDAYFHQSHLKGKQDYGHQAVAVMYDKTMPKVKIVQEIAPDLPVPPVMYGFSRGWCMSTLNHGKTTKKRFLDYMM